MAGLSLQKPSIMKTPTSIKRFARDHDPRDTWVPYPRQSKPIPAHTNCVINSLFDLMLIVRDVANYFFGDEKPLHSNVIKVIYAFYKRLKKWSLNLPQCISLGYASTPGIMDMQ